MNWGYRILFLYIGFVVLIMTLVFKSLNQKVDLVAKNYYDQELKFQDRIDAINNSNNLSEKISVIYNNKSVTLKFPRDMMNMNVKGKIKFYRPSDSALDREFELAINNNLEQQVSTQELQKGYYNIQINWEIDTKKYFYEHAINIK